MWKYKPNKPFLPDLLLVLCFITTTVAQTRAVALERDLEKFFLTSLEPAA